MSGSTHNTLSHATELIRDRFYFVCLNRVPKSTTQAHFLSIDDELVYLPFLADFGPLHLGCMHRFCTLMEDTLSDPGNAHRKVYLVTSSNQHLRANAACLCALFMVVVMGKSPDEAWRPLAGVYPPFTPFRDAAFGICTFDLTILDCCRGVKKAMEHGLYAYETFDVEEYDFYSRGENGDMNWVIPKKFLHLSTPAASHSMRPDGIRNHTPEDYIPYFRKHKVATVIRLNQKLYDRKRFTEAGIAHYDLFFTDGTTPPDPIIRRFMDICETVRGSIAIHCKAGLGRTGSLAGLYMMKHYRMTAKEVIAWLRIVRPGSVIGPQQHFLQDMQPRMWREGANAAMARSPAGSSAAASTASKSSPVRSGGGRIGAASSSASSPSSSSVSSSSSPSASTQNRKNGSSSRSVQGAGGSYSTPVPSRGAGAYGSPARSAGSSTSSPSSQHHHHGHHHHHHHHNSNNNNNNTSTNSNSSQHRTPTAQGTAASYQSPYAQRVQGSSPAKTQQLQQQPQQQSRRVTRSMAGSDYGRR